jgi:predicted transcriptional regulator
MQCWVCALFLPEVRLQLAAVTLAEEMNFTRAAKRLRITQPAPSKQISELESQIGFVVFKRSQRHVELTEADQVFIRGCRYALAILEKTIRLAKSTHDGVEPLITIGHSPYIDPSKSIRCGTEMLRGSLSQPFSVRARSRRVEPGGSSCSHPRPICLVRADQRRKDLERSDHWLSLSRASYGGTERPKF